MVYSMVPPPRSKQPRLNLDRFGMPKDYATYMWVLYKKVVQDESPERLAFLHGGGADGEPYFGWGHTEIWA